MFLTMEQYIELYLRHTVLQISEIGVILSDAPGAIPQANFWREESARPNIANINSKVML